MHKAVMLLLWNKEANSTGIAMDCGYADLSHMNRDLKKILGFNSTDINKIDFLRRDISSTPTVYKF